MATVTFTLVYGDQKIKLRNQPSNTSLDELSRIATEEFEVKDPVLFYYDTEDQEWLKVTRRFILSEGDQLKVLRTDENGRVVDPDEGNVNSGNSQGAAAGFSDAMQIRYTFKIEAILQSKSEAQGIAYVVGMNNASGGIVDVRRMETVLSDKLNFAVFSETNMSPDELKCLIKAAARKDYPLKCNYIVFYYAGHGGITTQGESFVCPINQPGGKDIVYKDRDIVRVLESGASISRKCLLFFFDCCVSNPGNLTSPYDLPANPIHNNCIVANATFFGEIVSGNFGGEWTRLLSEKLAEDKELMNLLSDAIMEVQTKHRQTTVRIQSNLTQKVNLKATAKSAINRPTEELVFLLLKDKLAQWDDIGRVLGLDIRFRQKLRQESTTTETKLKSVIENWIWSDTSTPVTWDGLINALKYLDYDDVITNIRAHYLPHPDTNEATPDDGGKPNYAIYLERAAAKGTVTTRISNLGLLGAAGTGKTSIKRLLTGQEPVFVHDSTPVLKPEEYYKEDANDDESMKQSVEDDEDEDFDWDSDQEETPVIKHQIKKRRTVPPAKLGIAIASSGNKWNLATQDTLLMRLANCVEIVAEQEHLMGDTTGASVDAGELLLDGFSMEKRNDPPTLIDTNQQEHELSITHDSANETSSLALSHALSQYDEVIKLVLDSVTPENLKKLGITHFVSISDTGGQAAFLDVAPALLRFNSVNLILIKLNERLEDPAQFFYSINGVRIGKESRQISTRSLVRSFIASKSKIQKPRTEGIKVAKPHQKPMFMILGTHFDKYKEEMATPNASCETKEEKNKSLKEDLSPFESSVYPKGSKMFFSLDTRNRDKDTLKLAALIRKLVLENYAEAEIPVSWYIFQLAMNKIKMDDKNEGMILLSTLTMLGRVSKIPADEVEAALVYFHDLQVCMFYPSVVPNVVFTDPQYLLDRISEIIAFSYGSRKVGMAKEEFENFTKYGRFKMSLLGSVCKQFKEYFSEKDFLALMGHLFIISSVPDTDEYFMPCILAEHPNPCEGFMDSSIQVEPLLLTWPNKCAPNGLFPSLSTNIQSRQGFNSIHFKMSSGVKQYRNRITLDCHDLGCEVVLIECDSFFGIAVHSMCLQPDSCVKIRGAIFSCLGAIVKRFGWLPSLAFPEKVFMCKIRPECKDRIHFCYPSRSLKVISCEIRSSSAMNQKDSHSIWWDKSEYQMNHSNGLTTLNLFRLLQDKSSKWDDIGRELGISNNFRAILDHDRSKTDDGRLEAVLDKWLEENLPKCTWLDIKKILIDNLKYNDIAQQIAADIH